MTIGMWYQMFLYIFQCRRSFCHQNGSPSHQVIDSIAPRICICMLCAPFSPLHLSHRFTYLLWNKIVNPCIVIELLFFLLHLKHWFSKRKVQGQFLLFFEIACLCVLLVFSWLYVNPSSPSSGRQEVCRNNTS